MKIKNLIYPILSLFLLTGCADESRTSTTTTTSTTVGKIGTEGSVPVVDSPGSISSTSSNGLRIDSGATVSRIPINPDFKVDKPFRIYGNIKGGARLQLVLDKLGVQVDQQSPISSQLIDEDGNFEFAGTISEPGLYQLRLPTGAIHLIVRGGDNIKVTSTAKAPYEYDTEGSRESVELFKLYTMLEMYNDRVRSFDEQIEKASGAALNNLMRSQASFTTKLRENKYKDLRGFITKNDTSLVALIAAMRFSPENDALYLQSVLDRLNPRFAGTLWHSSLQEKIRPMLALTPGKFAPELLLNDPSGSPIRLSDLQGKVVLIDFWASWCAPCRAANPKLLEVYKKYQPQGFEIMGVSLDTDRDAWKDAILKDGLTWRHGSDLQGWASIASQVYLISAIPSGFLVDKSGKIVARISSPEALSTALAKLL